MGVLSPLAHSCSAYLHPVWHPVRHCAARRHRAALTISRAARGSTGGWDSPRDSEEIRQERWKHLAMKPTTTNIWNWTTFFTTYQYITKIDFWTGLFFFPEKLPSKSERWQHGVIWTRVVSAVCLEDRSSTGVSQGWNPLSGYPAYLSEKLAAWYVPWSTSFNIPIISNTRGSS